VASGIGRRAFTLVELLVVVGIIALLVTILMPALSRALMLARRTTCKTTMYNHGRAVITYVHEYNSYPYQCPWPWRRNDGVGIPYEPMRYIDGTFDDGLYGFAKFYALMQTAGIRGTKMTTWGIWYYGDPVSAVWEGALCPAMKAERIWEAADKAGNFGQNSIYRVATHKWAVGFQWSPYLRGAHPRGRYPAHLGRDDVDWWQWQWIGHQAHLVRRTGYTQAVHPDEVADLASKAEAWDTWDLDSAPKLASAWGNRNMTISLRLTPGWHAGIYHSGGKAFLNGGRHEGSPNILYADGHVAADAEKPITGLSGDYEGLKAVTWDQWDNTFGNMNRLVPRCEFGP
jgi:prepilin-type processing-associated H-X9-DG protein/prepilin-type N-terminal cleavage/methylation domain-containing protein